ncbi:MAG: calcium-binding protein, partial [Planctomycetota bacterium]
MFQVKGTHASTETTLRGAAGDDTIFVTDTSDTSFDLSLGTDLGGRLDLVEGKLDIDAGAGFNELSISDIASIAADGAVVLTNASLLGLAAGDIFYKATGGTFDADADGLNGINIWGGTGGNTIDVQSTYLDADSLVNVITRLHAGSGKDVVDVSLGSLDGFLVVRGRQGNDTIDASTSTRDLLLFGDQGDDIIDGGTGSDVILGDGGRVYMLRPDGEADGHDTVFGGAFDDAHVTDLEQDADAFTLDYAIALYAATDGSDTVHGDGGVGAAEGPMGVLDGPIGAPDGPVGVPDGPMGAPDLVFGGGGDDALLAGDDGRDVIFGDLGEAVLVDGDAVFIRTLDPTHGGTDTLEGGDGGDVLFGGTAGDSLDGDAGNDLIFGDHGEMDLTAAAASSFTAIDTGFADGGGDDTMHGHTGDDTLLGQQGDDRMFGDEDDDDLIGGHNVEGGVDELDPASDFNDVMDGGEGQDVLAGDNAIIEREAGFDSPLVQVLSATLLYDGNLDPNTTGDAQANPLLIDARTIELLDHIAS